MGLLTHDEKQFFKDNGYLVKRDVLPRALLERAVDGLWHGVWADRRDPKTWVNAEPKKPESSDSDCCTGLLCTITACLIWPKKWRAKGG